MRIKYLYIERGERERIDREREWQSSGVRIFGGALREREREVTGDDDI